MEADDGPSTAINNNPATIRAAQEEMGRLDILVCGKCHSVFHFVEAFQEHRNREGACSEVSHFRENANHEQKAQVWAFLLWKDLQIQLEGGDKDSANSWKLYQKWCKMDVHIRDAWVTAGRTIQTFSKISNTKMHDSPRPQAQMNSTNEGGKIIVRKVIRNGQPEEAKNESRKEPLKPTELKNLKTGENAGELKDKVRAKPTIRPKVKPGKVAGQDDGEPSDTEYVVEKILAKRYNTKKRCSEYLLKWEGFSYEHNTWEPAETVGTCKFLLEEFERNLAKQKEIKAQQQAQQNAKAAVAARNIVSKTLLKTETSKAGPSSAAQTTPMRSSKSKALDQVKQWCGSMKDEDHDVLGKRRMEFSESDSEDAGSSAPKRVKGETGSDDDWTAESEEDRIMGRSDVIQRAFNRANVQSNGSNRVVSGGGDLASSLGLQSPEAPKMGQSPVLVANAKGVVKVDPKQMPNLTSGVYVMSRKDGIIKLDSSPGAKLAVKGATSASPQGVLMVQNRTDTINTVVRKQILATSQANSITPVKVVQKPDGSQVVTQMKVVTKNVTKAPTAQSRGGLVMQQKPEPIKIQPKPDVNQQIQQIHVVTAVPAPGVGISPRLQTSTTTTIRPNTGAIQRNQDASRGLLSRPALRGATPTSVLGMGATRTMVRATTPKGPQAATTPLVRQTLTKRVSGSPQGERTTLTSPQASAPPQIRPKVTVLTAQSALSQKPVTSPIVPKQSPKNQAGKPQSLLSPQQKLLMAKRKAQEAVGLVKSGNRGLLAGARAAQARGGRGKPLTSTGQPGTPTSLAAAALNQGNNTNKPKESKLVEGDSLHMEFHEVGSEESSNSDAEPDIPPQEVDNVVNKQPESPPRPFTLCPLTGRIIGPDGEPMETQAEPEVAAQTPSTTTSIIDTSQASITTTVAPSLQEKEATNSTNVDTNAELVLPSLDALTDAAGIMRVEMSPGGTTGTIVQSNEATPMNLDAVAVSTTELPCLDDSEPCETNNPIIATNENVSLAETTATSTETTASSIVTSANLPGNVDKPQEQPMETTTTTPTAVQPPTNPEEEKFDQERRNAAESEASNLVTITGEDGVVYQVAGHAEDGQTLLVTRSGDGEQSCVYVTTEQQNDDGSVLTLDHAVAEAVAQLIPDQVNLAPQFYVKEAETENNENQMVMSIMDGSSGNVATQEDPDGQAQVVAQVVQADEPTPGGTRRVVLLLPDGNLMMTEVDEEQYAALELDK
ncbi:uncharacterized protein Chro isoform X2 [Venturia canescens]|uniref:uncharacterized protein Chro isoform X2 n=1 Tax=Venturia canescens TaxID=32260 RepID=UPI001C9D481D|nr:uncharacterized protein LOC122409007 isoform X2 [Venturia canescens]